jgi:hypothetical protein
MQAIARHARRLSVRLSVFAAISAIALLMVFHASAQKPAPSAQKHSSAPKEKTAEQVYKNIKSFKGQPASQLIPTMQFMSSSLGVQCEFCHDMKAFDKDTKDEKVTAREMIAMQEGINRGHFKGKREVTCNSCHHGAQHPAAIPTVPELAAAIPVPVREHEHEHGAHHDAAAPTQYLDEFFAALGGEAALAKLSSLTQRGQVSFGQGPATSFESLTRASGQRAFTISLAEGPALTVFNGHAGWLVYPGRHSRPMSLGEAEATRVEADVEFPANFKTRYTQFRPGHPEPVNGKSANLLVASRPGQPPVRLYFDQASHLLIRVVYYVETPLGRNPTQIDITRYAESSGLQLPAEWTVTQPASRATYTVTSTDLAPIDDAHFAPPTSTEAAAH